MAKEPVTHYTLKWNPQTDAGTINIQIEGQKKPIPLPITTNEEFIATALVLSKPNVVLDTDTWVLETGKLSVGT